ncbi:MAG: hypothetical protein R2827_12570 [Bdellovibrionales bacterium]
MATRYRDAVEFIEDIPYEENCSYVRLVMRNMASYQVMNDPSKRVASFQLVTASVKSRSDE